MTIGIDECRAPGHGEEVRLVSLRVAGELVWYGLVPAAEAVDLREDIISNPFEPWRGGLECADRFAELLPERDRLWPLLCHDAADLLLPLDRFERWITDPPQLFTQWRKLEAPQNRPVEAWVDATSLMMLLVHRCRTEGVGDDVRIVSLVLGGRYAWCDLIPTSSVPGVLEEIQRNPLKRCCDDLGTRRTFTHLNELLAAAARIGSTVPAALGLIPGSA